MGAVSQRDEKLGVPTVLWADKTQFGNQSWRKLSTPEIAARDYLRELAPTYKLRTKDAESAAISAVHSLRNGSSIVKFKQVFDGVEVFRNELNVVLDRDNQLVAVTGRLTPYQGQFAAGIRGKRQLEPTDAVARAFADLSGHELRSSSFRTVAAAGANTLVELANPDSGLSYGLTGPARTKPVFFELSDRLVPAFYVEMVAGDLRHNHAEEVPADQGPDADGYSYVVDARNGAILFRNNLVVSDSFTYNVWADSATAHPYDGPQGNAFTPHPTGAPQVPPPVPPSLSRNLVTLESNLSSSDPWLLSGALVTTGNNVDAYADLVAPDGFGTGDLRASVTAPGVFDHPYDPAQAPNSSPSQIQAAVTQLFYMNNWLHDWFYTAGFDELSGNAQFDNYGRGGLGNDPIHAQAQDNSGLSNANMLTPSDGASPRMQMYLFEPDTLEITVPAVYAGVWPSTIAQFGPQVFNLSGDLALVHDGVGTGNAAFDGCQTPFTNSVAGKIAVLYQGVCTNVVKAQNAQAAGAIGVLWVANTDQLFYLGAPASPPIPAVTIPIVTTFASLGNALRTELQNSNTVSVNFKRAGIDGTLDNQIVAHEWGHYLTNRLIGDANGLSLNQARSMGEGWGDFVALLMTLREQDLVTDPNLTGAYAMAGYATRGNGFSDDPDSYYFGIRRVTYSTDFNKNALTFRHIQNGNPLPTSHPVLFGGDGTTNSQFHNSGEVWATTLWEVYTSLIKEGGHTFGGAQSRMKEYLVAALKMTPLEPTFLEARDALLAAAYLGDPNDWEIFWNAFARRGMGTGARGPARTSTTHATVTESFTVGADATVAGIVVLEDESCDTDNILDNGETGYAAVLVTNIGATEITDGVVTVTASPEISFPEGASAQLPPLAPYATEIAFIPVRLTGAAPFGSVSFSANVTSASLATTVAGSASVLVNYDDLPATSAIETVESGYLPWDAPTDPVEREPFVVYEEGPTEHIFWGYAPGALGQSYLVSPPLNVSATGSFSFTFQHRYEFEADSLYYYDGGKLELSTDGVNWTDIGGSATPGYNATISTCCDNPIAGQPAWGGLSPGYPAWQTVTVNLGTTYQGQTVQIRFRIATDPVFDGIGWDIDNLAFSGIDNTPFGSVGDDSCSVSAPIANAGADFEVDERSTANLTGSASDPDGDAITAYAWAQEPSDALQVTLSGSSSANASFATPEVTADTVLTFHLTVTDADGATGTDSVAVTVRHVNRPPDVDAGSDVNADERTLVQLSGTASDPDGHGLSYLWTADPDNAVAVTITGADTLTPSFTAPEVTATTALVFHLTVTDEEGLTGTDSVTVNVAHVNRPPTVSAGEDFSADERTVVTLSAAGSDEDEGQTLTYLWEADPANTLAVTLSGADTDTATFTAPEVTTATALRFTVTVTDNEGASQTDSVVVAIQHVNRAPAAFAGPDFSVDERTVGHLNGTGSDDDAEQSLTYEWTQDPTDALQVSLTGANTANASFTAPEVLPAGATLHFTFTVTDDEGGTGSDSVTVTVNHVNRPPTVNAGGDTTVAERTGVSLAATGSDPDEGQTLSYVWTQAAGDAVQVALTDANTATATFTAPEVVSDTVLNFTVTVSDGEGGTASDSVAITVQHVNRDPVANAGEDFSAEEGTEVTLNGSGNDQDEAQGQTLTYAWSQAAGDALQVTLSNANTASASFTAPEVTEDTALHFTLTVTDNEGGSHSDEVVVTITNVNKAPTVVAGDDQEVDERTTVTLSATGTDPDGDELTYAWTQVDGPTATLEGADTAEPTFTAPEVTGDSVLTFSVVASDGDLESEPDTVTITVRQVNRPPTANAGDDDEAESGASVTLAGSGTDPDGDSLTYAWEQTAGPSVTLSGANSANATFTAPAVETATTLTFRLTVRDPSNASASDTVSITVNPVEGGCGGCASSGGNSGLLFGGLFLLGLLRRRRRA